MLLAMAALVLIHTRGTTDVTRYWMVWADKILKFGFVDGYREIGMDYPPLTSQVLGFAVWVGGLVGATNLLSIKISALLALLASTAIFWRVTQHYWAAILFFVAVMLHSAGDGYLDIYYAPLLIGALTALRNNRFGWFSLFYAIACLFKWQPLIIGPFLGIYIWRKMNDGTHSQRDRLSIVIQCLTPPLLAGLAAILIFGAQPLGHALYLTFTMHKMLSAFALNLPWVVSHTLEVVMPERFGSLNAGEAHILNNAPNGVQLALRLLFVGVYGLLMLRAWTRSLSFTTTVSYCLAGFMTYCLLSTGVHENHMFIAVLLALYLFSMSEISVETVIWVAVMLNVNLYLFYSGDGILAKLPRNLFGVVDTALLASIFNCVVYGAWVFGYLRREHSVRRPVASPHPVSAPVATPIQA